MLKNNDNSLLPIEPVARRDQNKFQKIRNNFSGFPAKSGRSTPSELGDILIFRILFFCTKKKEDKKWIGIETLRGGFLYLSDILFLFLKKFCF